MKIRQVSIATKAGNPNSPKAVAIKPNFCATLKMDNKIKYLVVDKYSVPQAEKFCDNVALLKKQLNDVYSNYTIKFEENSNSPSNENEEFHDIHGETYNNDGEKLDGGEIYLFSESFINSIPGVKIDIMRLFNKVFTNENKTSEQVDDYIKDIIRKLQNGLNSAKANNVPNNDVKKYIENAENEIVTKFLERNKDLSFENYETKKFELENELSLAKGEEFSDNVIKKFNEKILSIIYDVSQEKDSGAMSKKLNQGLEFANNNNLSENVIEKYKKISETFIRNNSNREKFDNYLEKQHQDLNDVFV